MSGMKYKDIAEKYDVSINTVKSWKTRYKWSKDKKGVHTKPKSMHTKKDTRNKESITETKAAVTDDLPLNEDGELTDKQWLFCMYYVKYFNATKAYQKAYECDYFTANANGSRLLVKASIKSEIESMKKEVADGLMLDASAVLQKYIDIALADITDFVEFGKKEVQAMGAFGPLEDEEGNPIMVEVNYVDFQESSMVDGTIITEVKKGKDGVSIKLADKMKALEFLSKYTDLLSDNDRKKLQEEKLKADIAKARSETKGSGNANINVVDFSNLSTEELRAIANSNK
ncbi:terminase small subunit [Peribacillus asahii]|uniref:Terminase small subunit n=2 Tax=Peribacillus asahii TaxID=228899 RepID=A0A398BIJ9_9BACI|nr:terminase small subunit [Peribacillus asahii]